MYILFILFVVVRNPLKLLVYLNLNLLKYWTDLIVRLVGNPFEKSQGKSDKLDPSAWDKVKLIVSLPSLNEHGSKFSSSQD